MWQNPANLRQINREFDSRSQVRTMKSSAFLLAVPFLLGTTALVHAADPAQAVYIDDARPFFSYQWL